MNCAKCQKTIQYVSQINGYYCDECNRLIFSNEIIQIPETEVLED